MQPAHPSSFQQLPVPVLSSCEFACLHHVHSLACLATHSTSLLQLAVALPEEGPVHVWCSCDHANVHVAHMLSCVVRCCCVSKDGLHSYTCILTSSHPTG
jgi:hypothetical protein